MAIYYANKEELFPSAQKKIVKAGVVLDIGCGIKPQRLIRPKVHICFEPYREYLDVLVNKFAGSQDRNFIFLNGTWADALERLPKKTVDTVFLLDVIEHLNKDEALDLLRKTEELARKQVVIFTTLGFMPQHHEDGTDAWGLQGGEWQEHKSGWEPEEFGEGWDVFVAKKYHFRNNLGEELSEPSGAIIAIKTNSSGEQYRKKQSFKTKLKQIVKNSWMFRNLVRPTLKHVRRSTKK